MFKKRERLNRSEFSHYFEIGLRKHSKYLTFIILPSPTRKVAVVVGKKVAKSAVKRNTIRRRVYAVLRKQLQNYHGVFIVLVKPSLAALPRKAAELEVITAIAQVTKSA